MSDVNNKVTSLAGLYDTTTTDRLHRMLGVISLACGQSLPEMLIAEGNIVMRLHRYESDNVEVLAALALAGITYEPVPAVNGRFIRLHGR